MIKKIINKETALYLFFGILTTIINIIVFHIMEQLSDNIIINNTIAWICSVLFAFITNKTIVFKTKGNFIKEILLFFSSRIVSLIFDNLLILILVEKIKLDALISKIITNIFVVIINYVLSKIIVFRKNKSL